MGYEWKKRHVRKGDRHEHKMTNKSLATSCPTIKRQSLNKLCNENMDYVAGKKYWSNGHKEYKTKPLATENNAKN